MDERTQSALRDAFRSEWAHVLAATIRVTHDIDLAEDSVQQAFTEALAAWSRDGVPRNPGAWLTTTAKRRAIDALRRNVTQQRKIPLLIEPERPFDEDANPATRASGVEMNVATDDTMRLILLCCHPSLSNESQVALTLRLVCGMTTDDIARCFLVEKATMAARLTRAKKKIVVARIPFCLPRGPEVTKRLEAVMGVVYLLFTIGHTSPTGDTLFRRDVCAEALRLARLLHGLWPEVREISGLLALLLVNDARRDSRVSPVGRAQSMADQDRAKWNTAMIDEARQLMRANHEAGPRGRYTLQAAIALQHVEAPTYDEVDWHEIVQLYDELVQLWSTPVVQLNRAVALSKTSGPLDALAIVEGLETDARLERYHYLPAVKAYLLDQLGRSDEAQRARHRAFELSSNEVERDFLGAQLRGASPH